MPKLTLSADDKVIKQAKRIAAKNHTSVSAMFSRFVRTLAQKDRPPAQVGRIARKASGIIKLPKGKSEQDVLADALADKYGLRR